MTGSVYSDNVVVTDSNGNKSAQGLHIASLSKKTLGLDSSLSGLIGLAFNRNEEGENIVFSLLEAGKRLFSIYLYLNETLQQLLFGAYDTSLIKPGDSSEGFGIHWFNLANQADSWSIVLKDARYGYSSFLKGSANIAVFASGLRFINVPKGDFDYLGGLW